MKQNKIGYAIAGLIIIIIIIILIAPNGSNNNQKLAGIVTAIDLDQIAVDGSALITAIDNNGQEFTVAVASMGINLCAALDNIASPAEINIGDQIKVHGSLNSENQIYPCDDKNHYLRATNTYQDSQLGIEFDYPTSPQGYELDAYEIDGSDNLIAHMALYRQSDRRQVLPAASEDYPHIDIRAYDNIEKQSPSVWSLNNQMQSNEGLKTSDGKELSVGGANAYQFDHDGLWLTKTTIIANDSKIFIVSTPIIPDTNFEADYKVLLKNIRFIPTSSVSGMKIDITQVCNDALAFSSFVDGAADDKFVKDCVDGKHPEIIDQYIQSQGLDATTI